MIPVRRACLVVLACAFAVAGLAGCSSGHGSAPQCCSVPHAYALDVTTAGRVRWQVRLATYASGAQLSPLAAGTVAVFAQGDVVFGLRMADGHKLWSRAITQGVAGMWRWRSLVIVLTEPGPGGLSLLTGLNAGTGLARWTLSVGFGINGVSPTADGGLAIVIWDSVLEVVDLSSGRVRWARPAGPVTGIVDSAMAVAGGVVLTAVNGQLTSYDDQTGQIRWTEALTPLALTAGSGDLSLQASGGLVYLTGVQQGIRWPPSQLLLGVSAADGHVEWQFTPSQPETLWVYAPGLMSATSSSGRIWQDELDPATGRVRWRAASVYRAIATAAGVVTAPGTGGTDRLSLRDTLSGQTRWTAALAGLSLGWQRQAPALPVFPAGPFLVVPAAGPHGSELVTALRVSDGHRAWQITIPEPVAAPPSAVPGGMLLNSAIVLNAP
jgi:outer membrane protein assembly factor BamB